MEEKTNTKSHNYIVPLLMNGLQGRMLRMPAPPKKNREILVIYGQHASIERMEGLAFLLNRYGAVTMPDLPGFGGMQSFYKIGEKPTLDNMADYLASFVKLRYTNRRFTIVAMSFGFVVVTKMLQKYPELSNRVDILVSFVGFVSHKDFKISHTNFLLLRTTASLLSTKWLGSFVQHVTLQPFAIRLAYKLVEDSHSKLHDADELERKRRVDFEIKLWQANDIRTQGDTATSMFKLDMGNRHIDLAVHHVGVEGDRYFDNNRVEEHMRTIYKDFIHYRSNMPNHAPSVVATAEEAEIYIPPKLRKILANKP